MIFKVLFNTMFLIDIAKETVRKKKTDFIPKAGAAYPWLTTVDTGETTFETP